MAITTDFAGNESAAETKAKLTTILENYGYDPDSYTTWGDARTDANELLTAMQQATIGATELASTFRPKLNYLNDNDILDVLNTSASGAALIAAGVIPIHWFDFVNDRALYASNDVGGVSGATGYSFSRASQGYYTNSDGTLTLFGYNLLRYSQEFDNASWTKQANVSVTGVNAGVAPDGTTTADEITLTATSNDSVFQGVSAAAATTYTASIYVKGAGGQTVQVGCQPSGVAPVFTSVVLDGTWQRISATATSGGAGTLNVSADLVSGTTPAVVQIWGAQLEAGSQATTYIPTTSAAAGALRRGDRGVLIEGARTNLLVRSQEFDNASWTKTRATATADAIAAPDGTLTAVAFIEDTTAAASHEISQSVGKAASAIAYTASVYVRPAGRDWLCFTLFDNSATGIRAWFNVTTGALGTTAAIGAGFTSVSHSIEALAGGWYRCILTATSSTVAAIRPIFYTSTADGSFSHTGDGTSGLYIWGAQLEAASFPSSYIPTTTASATRAADVLTCTLNSTAELAAAAAASPELVTNGGFTSGDTGWTIGGTGGSQSVVSGELQVVRTVGGTSSSQSFTTVSGRTYVVDGVQRVVSGSAQPNLVARTGSDPAATVVGNGAATSSGTMVANSFVFVATGTTTFIHLQVGTANGTVAFDNISVKEVPAEQTALYPLSLWVEFEREVDTGNDEYLLHVVNSGTERAFIFVGTSDNAGASSIVTAGNTGVATTAGTVAVGATHKIAGRIALNNTQVALAGTLATADTTADLPAKPTLLRIGSFDATLRHPFGYIRRAAVIPSALSDAQLQAVTT